MSNVYTTDTSLLKREITPSGGTFATIPAVSNIVMPEWKRKSVSINIHDQAAPVTKYGGGEPMEMSFDIALDMDDTYHAALLTDYAAKTSRKYTVTLDDAGPTVFTFDAVVGGFKIEDLDAEGKILKATCTLSLAADPVIT